MTESREQYRERLAWTAYRAFMDHIMDHIKVDRTKEYDELLPETKDAMHAEAEAVAAQVLRDVIALSFMTYIPGTDDLAPIVAVSQIKRFAADRGIDLEDTP